MERNLWRVTDIYTPKQFENFPIVFQATSRAQEYKPLIYHLQPTNKGLPPTIDATMMKQPSLLLQYKKINSTCVL